MRPIKRRTSSALLRTHARTAMRTSKTPPYVKEGEGERRGGLGERKEGDGEGGEGGTKRVGVRRRDTKYIN